jgi:glucokinase
MILAGDIGGTHARLAYFAVTEELAEGNEVAMGTGGVVDYPSREYAGLEEILDAFRSEHPLPITHAGFAIAGPVRDGRTEATNLPWTVDAGRLAQRLGLDNVVLLNDLEATAHGIATLAASERAVIQEGLPDPAGNAAVIAAGTGLGEAGLYWDGRRHQAFATEGGHASFAPADAQQEELLRWLRRRWDHVSWERVVSGPGLLNLHRFLRETGQGVEPPWLADAMAQGDPSAAITQAALTGRSELCERSLDLFVTLLAAEAGNLALKMMATGGVYLGGGIAPKIGGHLMRPEFREAFAAKGRMRPLLEKMPVHLILNDKTALRGAARRALQQGQLAAGEANHSA